MNGLQAIGILTHFIKRLNMREQLVRKCEIIPLEVIVRNYAAGTISKRRVLKRARRCRARSLNIAMITVWVIHWSPKNILPHSVGPAKFYGRYPVAGVAVNDFMSA